MTVVWTVLFFLVGATVGSFITVVTDRLPEGKSIISPPSHCPGCLHNLSASDLIPIISYLRLKGRCRYCGVTIPMRLLWVELGTASLFAFLFWHYGLSLELVIVAFYCCLFIILLVTDLEHNILPNRIVYPGIVIALVLAVVVMLVPTLAQPDIKSAAIGGAIGFGFLLIPGLIYRGGMGWGDIKLAGLIGLVTGFPLVLLAMFLAILSGGLTAAILVASKLRGRKDTIPFGPFLCVAAMATLFWGTDMLNWLNLS